MEKTHPGAETVIHALGLLTRLARHSLSAAWSLASTPRLLTVILDSFLPHNVSPLLSGQTVASMTSVYGVPLRHALQLLRVGVFVCLCFSGVASCMWSRPRVSPLPDTSFGYEYASVILSLQ